MKVEFTIRQQHCDQCRKTTEHRVAVVRDKNGTREIFRCLTCPA